ncbi:hypothetical protein ACQ86G_02655 [Roseateles chitinivorans]|uniref:hypothetical protein n=1 Tax=Roseateles chitinivorans TaxID=2917965 RepID=UPI003D675D7C
MTVRFQLDMPDEQHYALERIYTADSLSFPEFLARAVSLFLMARNAARNGNAVGFVSADQRATLKEEFSGL